MYLTNHTFWFIVELCYFSPLKAIFLFVLSPCTLLKLHACLEHAVVYYVHIVPRQQVAAVLVPNEVIAFIL